MTFGIGVVSGCQGKGVGSALIGAPVTAHLRPKSVPV